MKKTFAVTIAILVSVFAVSLCVGKYHLSLGDILAIMTFRNTATMASNVFFKLRLPRTVMAMLAGAGLGLAGAVYQTVFKNPLASPDIIGISSGANLGAAVAIVIASQSMLGVGLGAFAGGVCAVLFVMLLVKATNANTTSTYVLSGIIISSVAKAMIMMLKYYADSDSELAAIEYWTMGSLASITINKLLGVLGFWLVGFVGTMFLSRQVQLLSLNEDECRALGVNITKVRAMVLGFSTLLVSSVISVTGLISFSGLIAPHIAAFITKTKNKNYLWISSLIGACVLLISDIFARGLSTSEIPISILTTIIGVPVLVFFMLRRKGGRV